MVAVARIAVLGAGNGGCAAAADLGNRGFQVSISSRSPQRLQPLIDRGGIQMLGACGEAFVPIDIITTDARVAVRDADLVMLAVPVSAHPYYAGALAEVLPPDQPVFLNPGHMGGGLFFSHEVFRRTGRTDLRTCETTTLTYGCRIKEPGSVHINHVASNLAFAAFPGRFQAELYELVRPLYSEITEARDVLETGFLDINAVEHPPQMICNAGWVEATAGEYLFYYEGTTPAVGRVIDELDRERLAIAQAMGIPAKPFVRYFFEAGYTTAAAAATGSAHRALRESAPNRWIKGPASLDHRYIHEDIGWGLVPWSQMGDAFGISTPTMDALVRLGSVFTGIDYRTEGLTLAKLGLEDRDLTELDTFLEHGLR